MQDDRQVPRLESQNVNPGDYFSILQGSGEVVGGVWFHRGDKLLRVNVHDAENSPLGFVGVNPGEDALAAASRHFRGLFREMNGRIVRMRLAPGEYYPRMARPSEQHPKESPGSCSGAGELANEAASMRGQLAALVNELADICQVIQPSAPNMSAFGHRIRNLLILACTEVEVHWKGVLVANGVDQDRMTTRDYVRLNRSMKLNEYGVNFPHFPWLEEVRPFATWSEDRPTESLPWYDAYNAVKHDREARFSRGTLQHAFDALSACFVMMCSEFGEGYTTQWRPEFSYLALSRAPVWPYEEIYTPSYDARGNIAVNYTFG